MIYQFTSHKNLPPNSPCPEHRMFDFYRRLDSGEPLSMKEELIVINSLYGTFGAHSSTFKFGGFAAPFHTVLNRFLVNQYNSWREYYGFDEKSLMTVINGDESDEESMIQEIVKAPVKVPA